MLTKVEALSARALEPILLAVNGSADTDPIQLLDVTGLEPVKSAVTTVPFGDFDGESYAGASVGKRNIVLTFGLNPNWATQTIEDLRKLVYQYFMPKLPVRLRFVSTHLNTCHIDGYVESVEPNMFSKDPQIQVSIICPMPYFVASESTVIAALTGVGVTFTNDGNISFGCVLKVSRKVGVPTQNTIQIVLENEYADHQFASQGNLTPNIYFVMSSVQGRKYIRSVHSNGTIVDYLNTLDPTSKWPLIYPGVNTITVNTPIAGQDWELTYSARYGGL